MDSDDFGKQFDWYGYAWYGLSPIQTTYIVKDTIQFEIVLKSVASSFCYRIWNNQRTFSPIVLLRWYSLGR